MTKITEPATPDAAPGDAEPRVVQDIPTPDVGKAAREGGLWAAISYALSKVLGFTSSIVLARLLMPEQFGLIGMVNTVLGLVQILGVLGIGAAIIHQRTDIEEYANTGWWMDVFCGVALFVLSNAAAPFAAVYYKEPRVAAVILVASINYLINPVGNTMDVLLRRDLKFKISTRIGLIQATIASCLTIILALSGAGVWSFVLPHLLAGPVAVWLRWRNCSFRPHLRVRWEFASKIWQFGRNVLGSTVFDYINNNIDYVLVGGILGGRQLGIYVFAYGLGTWIVGNIAGAISGVLFPTFAGLQDDRDRARAMFLKLIGFIATLGFPIVCIQWSIAHLYVGSIYGDKWLESVTAFRLIALYGMARAVCAPALILISAMGRPDVNFKVSAAMSPLLIVGIYIGSHYGVNGVALATAVVNGLFVWLYILVPFRILGWRPADAVGVLYPPFVCALLSGVAAWSFQIIIGRGNSLPVLIGALAAATAVYMASSLALFPKRSEELERFVRSAVVEARA